MHEENHEAADQNRLTTSTRESREMRVILINLSEMAHELSLY